VILPSLLIVLVADKLDWINISTIGGAGIAYSLLSILDIGSGKPEIIQGAQLNGSPIFVFEQSGWV
jgi:hypothetical protein